MKTIHTFPTGHTLLQHDDDSTILFPPNAKGITMEVSVLDADAENVAHPDDLRHELIVEPLRHGHTPMDMDDVQSIEARVLLTCRYGARVNTPAPATGPTPAPAVEQILAVRDQHHLTRMELAHALSEVMSRVARDLLDEALVSEFPDGCNALAERWIAQSENMLGLR